ncbi:MAG: hypothetical protein ABIJ45_12730 [Candidatus Zixiibacteriota bacterium]
MIAVAVGAVTGRYLKSLNIQLVMLTGVLLLPLSLVLIRLSPIMFGTVPGEYLPFYISVIIAIVGLIPVGLISGIVFTTISNEGHRPAASVARVYLWEGVGAFIGGIMVYALVGSVLSGIAMSLILAILIVFICRTTSLNLRIYLLIGFGIIGMATVTVKSSYLERYLDQLKYSGFQVVDSFDTKYSHQALLKKDDLTILMTNGSVEVTRPDIEFNEDLLLSGLAYLPGDSLKKVLYVGRPEFGLGELAAQLDNIRLDCFDPRTGLAKRLKKIDSAQYKNVTLFETDLLASLRGEDRLLTKYDLIVLYFASFDSFESSRYLERESILKFENLLANGGILQIVLDIDTDRHISDNKRLVLQSINNNFRPHFASFNYWPGNVTLLFYAGSNSLNIEYDAVVSRLNSLYDSSQYLNENYLFDKFEPLKRDRLDKLLERDLPPIKYGTAIIHFQLLLTATQNKIDSIILPNILFPTYSPILVGAILLIGFISILFPGNRRRRFALILYLIAGFVSISVELIAFYQYQLQAGMLYGEISILIAVFMLGLALGTYYSGRLNKENLEFPSLLLLLSSIFIFYFSYQVVVPSCLLLYYIAFIFVTAMATGSLFVAATDRYYFGKTDANRGLGYAFEISGSALGALTIATLIVPLFGANFVLVSLMIILIITLIGAMVTVNR